MTQGIVYYARGGGLGHLTRARAFLWTLGYSDAVIVADRHDLRVTGDIPVVSSIPPGDLILDTFPAGLLGEIHGGVADYVARYVRWDRYALPDDPPRIRRAYILEPLHPEQEHYVRSRASVVQRLELRDPPASGPLPDLPPNYVLVIHSEPKEREELLDYARDVCREEGVTDPIVAPDVYPATLVAANATRIFTGGGFNAMRQFGGDPRHRPLPFERRFDDQYARVARFQDAPLVGRALARPDAEPG